MGRLSSALSVTAVCALVAVGALALPASGGQSKQAKWTFAIYMCSDNDLDAYGELNMEWLMSAPNSKDVNFVVLWDTSTGPANLYKVSNDAMIEMTDFPLNGREVNMGDPNVLVSFVDYLSSKFPASNVMLDLWNHGDDFRGICYDYDPGIDGSYDLLTHAEIGDSLAGKNVDIVAGDGCGILCIEAAYEYVVRGVTAEWFVANENYVPLDGFPYNWIAEDLVANPGMTPEQLSKDIVVRYEEYYSGPGWLTELAAVKLTEVADLVDQLWDVTAILEKEMKTYRGLIVSGKAHATMGWSQYGWEACVDMPKVFEVIYAGAPMGSKLKLECAELLGAINSAVPYIGAGSPGYIWDFGGIAIFFPGAEGSFVHNTSWRGSFYPELAFAQDGWLDFLNAYFGGN